MGAYNVTNRAALATGQPEDISAVVANLDAIATVLNGGIDNSNINAAAAIAASKLAGYPTNGAKVLAGDGTWKDSPKITTSLMSGGPPAGPGDGDIWIAKSSGANGERWQFQYNAGSASAFKWEFIGGSVVGLRRFSPDAFAGGALTNDAFLGSLTIPRAGEYRIQAYVYGILTASGNQTFSLAFSVNGVPSAAIAQHVGSASWAFTISYDYRQAFAANDTLTNAYASNGAGNYTISSRWIGITPVRIS